MQGNIIAMVRATKLEMQLNNFKIWLTTVVNLMTSAKGNYSINILYTVLEYMLLMRGCKIALMPVICKNIFEIKIKILILVLCSFAANKR